MLQTPWAILLCKFSGNDSEPFPRKYYESLFTKVGQGTRNMVDFFQDMSHGNLDLSGSQVFGWFTLDQKRSDYSGSGANSQGRQDLIDWARAKAAADGGVDFSKFFNVVVCMNVQTDLFGGGSGAVCDNLSMQPSLLGQEMGHGYLLDHSRQEGSTADYMDNWDVMSTAGPYEAADPNYGFIGPGLNAANMDSRGWLDESRLWTQTPASYNSEQTVQLRPLHRRDLPGFLAARVWDGYLVEFRVPEKWDAGIPRAAVLVHRFEDNHSYIEPGNRGNFDLIKGDKFQIGNPANYNENSLVVEVLDIDAPGHVATLGIKAHIYIRPRVPLEGPFHYLGGVLQDGGGWIWINGHLVPVPPRSELIGFLQDIAAVQMADAIPNSIRSQVKAAGYQSIVARASARLGKLTGFREPRAKSSEN